MIKLHYHQKGSLIGGTQHDYLVPVASVIGFYIKISLQRLGYFLVNYWSVQAQRLPKQSRLLSLLLDALQN